MVGSLAFDRRQDRLQSRKKGHAMNGVLMLASTWVIATGDEPGLKPWDSKSDPADVAKSHVEEIACRGEGRAVSERAGCDTRDVHTENVVHSEGIERVNADQ
jgi:hypothetical protein